MSKTPANSLGNSVDEACVPLFTYLYENDSRKMLHVSEGLCRLMGLGREETLAYFSKPLYQLVHHEDLPRVVNSLDRARANNEHYCRLSYRLHMPRGERYIWASSYIARETLPSGSSLYYVSLVDITAEYEETAREKEKNVRLNAVFEKILDTTQLAIFWKDKNRRFLGANKAFLDYYDFPSESVILGKTDEDMGWHEDNDPYRNDEIWVLNTGRSTYRVPGRCMSHGTMRDIVASKSPIVEHGEITGLVGTFEDVTDDKLQQKKILELNERLVVSLKRTESANRAKTAFLSNVSHDMRTPLNGIMGFARLALETQEEEQIKEYLKKILLSGELLQDLINDTLELSRIANGRIKLEPEVVDAEHIFDSLLLSINAQASAKQVDFRTDLRLGELGTVRVDVLKLSKVLLNLLSNAVKFTPEGGKVLLTAEPVSEAHGSHYKCRFTVKDTGIGMSASFMNRMFEPFEQENRKSVQGTGLGLSIAKQLVELLGGTIRAKSKQGEGTEFYVELYLEQVTTPVPAEDNQEKSLTSLAGRCILLCEDHPLNREIAATILEAQGIKVLQAENGRLGLEMVSDSELGAIDAILMDIRMPEMDGLQASKAIRSLPRKDAQSVPILALSANAFKEDIDRSKAVGMNYHLTKPIDPKIMMQELARHIAAYDKIKAGWEELKGRS